MNPPVKVRIKWRDQVRIVTIENWESQPFKLAKLAAVALFRHYPGFIPSKVNLKVIR